MSIEVCYKDFTYSMSIYTHLILSDWGCHPCQINLWGIVRPGGQFPILLIFYNIAPLITFYIKSEMPNLNLKVIKRHIV